MLPPPLRSDSAPLSAGKLRPQKVNRCPDSGWTTRGASVSQPDLNWHLLLCEASFVHGAQRHSSRWSSASVLPRVPAAPNGRCYYNTCEGKWMQSLGVSPSIGFPRDMNPISVIRLVPAIKNGGAPGIAAQRRADFQSTPTTRSDSICQSCVRHWPRSRVIDEEDGSRGGERAHHTGIWRPCRH